MATLTIRIKTARKDGTRPVRIRIANKYTESEIGTVYAVEQRDLNSKGEIKNMRIKDGIDDLMRSMRRYIEELGTAVKNMTAKEIAEYIIHKQEAKDEQEKPWSLDIMAYMNADADALERDGSEGTASLRRTVCRSLQAYMGKETMDVSELTTAVLNGWVRWLCNRNGNGCRAASLYPTQLRAVFNKARLEFNDDYVTRIVNDPFSRMNHVRMPAPNPRSITAEQLRAIAALPDRGGRHDLARDVFLLSFYLVGMNSVDLLNCPPIEDGRVTYERTKTRTRRQDKALISIAVPKEALPLIEKYKGHRKNRAFIFCERYSNRNCFSRALNAGLKDIAEELKMDGLQFYAARHTWATLAVNEAGVDKYTVHLALNHVDDKTAVTDIYIRKSWVPIDEANRKVIDYVFKPKDKKTSRKKGGKKVVQ